MRIGEILYVLYCASLFCVIFYTFGFLLTTFSTGWILDKVSESGYYVVCEPGYTDTAMSCDLVKS